MNTSQMDNIESRWFARYDIPMTSEMVGIRRHFLTWDSSHYIALSKYGYRKGTPSNAFFPLWPALIALGTVIIRDPLWSAIAISNLLSALGSALFYLEVRRLSGSTHAFLSLLLFILYPGNLYFQFAYSESLFFTLLMMLWRGLNTGNYILASVGSFLLPLARGVGFFVAIPLVALCVQSWRERTRRDNSSCALFCPMICIFFVGVGALAYFALMHSWCGNHLEGFQAQKFWGVQSIGNLFKVHDFFAALAAVTCFHGFQGSALDRAAFLFLYIFMLRAARMNGVWFFWILALGILPAITGHFVSFIRFSGMAFPLFVALAARGTIRSLSIWAFATVFLILHLVLIWRFVNYRWAG